MRQEFPVEFAHVQGSSVLVSVRQFARWAMKGTGIPPLAKAKQNAPVRGKESVLHDTESQCGVGLAVVAAVGRPSRVTDGHHIRCASLHGVGCTRSVLEVRRKGGIGVASIACIVIELGHTATAMLRERDGLTHLSCVRMSMLLTCRISSSQCPRTRTSRHRSFRSRAKLGSHHMFHIQRLSRYLL